MKKNGDPYVYLDITHKSEDFLQTRFPNLFNACLKYGINMATQPIPVVPAAHSLVVVLSQMLKEKLLLLDCMRR